ncbi:MAG TPA: peptide transporter, partial [Methanophagales archaeon]|nr:peptide transporter [Methanophagales archaeon]
MQKNSNDEKAWFDKGNDLIKSGKYKEAIECFDKIIEITKDKVGKIWYLKGLALTRLNRQEEAIECFDKAIDINPNNETAWLFKKFALDD